MQLALRFVLVLMLPIAGIISINGALRVKRETRLFVAEVAAHHAAMGRAVGAALQAIFPDQGHEGAAAYVSNASAAEALIDLEWLTPDGLSSSTGERLVTNHQLQMLRANQDVVVGSPTQEARLMTIVPIGIDGRLAGAIVLRETLERERKYLDDTIELVVINVLLTVAAAALVTLLLGYFLVGRRIGCLVALAEDVAHGRPSEALAIGGRDEIGQLGEEMKAMAAALEEGRARLQAETNAKIRAVEQLRHADRLRTVGQLASGMAHELGTPMNVILGRAQILERESVDATLRQKSAGIIVSQIEKMSAVIRQVLDFSREQSSPEHTANVCSVAENVVDLVGRMSDRSVKVVVDCQNKDAVVRADSIQIDQAITNLVVNAVQASPDAGQVRVCVSVTVNAPPVPLDWPGEAPDKWVRVRVSDEGDGIADSVRDKIFDPFFTTKEVGQGTGLGLSVAFGLVRDHGGVLVCDPSPEVGASFSIWLPHASTLEPVSNESTKEAVDVA